jgi:hypothetical protein
MYRMATIGLALLILGILTGGIIALVVLGLAGFAYGVRRLDSDIHAWDGERARLRLRSSAGSAAGRPRVTLGRGVTPGARASNVSYARRARRRA